MAAEYQPRTSCCRRSGVASYFVTVAALGLLLTPAVVAGQDAKWYTGFAERSVGAQRSFERLLQETIDTAHARRWAEVLSAVPHVAGSPRQRWTAFYVDSLTRAWGLDSRVDSSLIYLPQPRSASLARQAPNPKELIVTEPRLEVDPATQGRVFPAFNGYTGRGDVTGEVVYANYGLIEDYAKLDSLGVSAKGRIVIARYGRSFRGIKAREAERHGAAGLVLYSDPADDGYVRGDVYPEGPYRPRFGVQRGSIKNGSGDPSTPGWPSTFDARRVPEPEMPGIAHIPVLPVGYGTAAELLEGLRGAGLPEQAWQGGLPFRYHVGPGPVTARLAIDTEQGDAAMHPVFNTIAVLEGSEYPDEWVIVGAHRDAWGPGAIDNVSGTVSVLEMARAFAQLARGGIRLQRTIVFATWDAEEWGLIGSTEWVEEHAEQLRVSAVAYVNQDVVASGRRFSASAAGPLKGVVREVMRGVPDPFQTDRSVYEVWRAARGSGSDEPSVGDLGGGSDFAGFYNYLGVPAAGLGFGGAGGGVYHSAYDSHRWIREFGDPEFRAHAGAARSAGTLVARLANADVLPADYVGFAKQLAEMVERAGESVAKPGLTVDLNELQAGVRRFAKSAERLAAARDSALVAGRAAGWRRINQHLLQVDKQLTRDAGLEGRPWMRNLIFAADRDNGYGNMPFPSVYEAVRDRDQARTAREVADLARRLISAASVLDAASK